MLEDLKAQVCQANKDLEKYKLVTLTWGNVSGLDRNRGIVAIKPSGVEYADLTPEKIVLMELHGKVIEGGLRPSSDAPTHLALYRAFKHIGGVTHTHSTYATAFAQACRAIPCFGTTHADHFRGEVPVTRRMVKSEVTETPGEYELNTGLVIVERFRHLDVHNMPAVLVANHGPFTWGKDAAGSVVNSVALEQVAQMALGALTLNGGLGPISEHLLSKHFDRKHGRNAYYGQK